MAVRCAEGTSSEEELPQTEVQRIPEKRWQPPLPSLGSHAQALHPLVAAVPKTVAWLPHPQQLSIIKVTIKYVTQSGIFRE